MRQKVRDDELRVGGVISDGDVNLASIAADDFAVQLQRHRHPLVLADAAVVVGLEIGKLAVFIEGIRLDVEPGRVGVRRADVRAVRQILFADDGKHDRLAAVVPVELVAGLDGHAGVIRDEASRFRFQDGGEDAFALSFGAVEEGFVCLAVGIQFLFFRLRQAVVAVFRLIEKGVSLFFGHGVSSFVMSFRRRRDASRNASRDVSFVRST